MQGLNGRADTSPWSPSYPDPKDIEAAGLAVLFAICVLAIPFEYLRGAPFVDFNVYVEKFSSAGVRDVYDPRGVIDYFRYEVFWDDSVRILVNIVGTPESALRLISGFVLATNAFLLFRRYGYFLPTILLFNPVFLDLALSQLRIAFAISLVLIAFESRSRNLQWLAALVATFVHSSIPIFVGVFLVSRFVENRASQWSTAQILLTAGALLALLVGALVVGRDAALAAIEDRRAYLYESVSGSSKLFLVFWGCFLVMQLMAGVQYLKRADNFCSLIMVGMFVALTVLGTYGSRFLAASFCLVIASVLNFDRRNRNAIVPALIMFQIVSLMYWLQWV